MKVGLRLLAWRQAPERRVRPRISSSAAVSAADTTILPERSRELLTKTRLTMFMSTANSLVPIRTGGCARPVQRATDGGGLGLRTATKSTLRFASLVARERMLEPLERAHDWLLRNNATALAVVLLVLGGKLVGDGIAKL